jgi:hypothetical protein
VRRRTACYQNYHEHIFSIIVPRSVFHLIVAYLYRLYGVLHVKYDGDASYAICFRLCPLLKISWSPSSYAFAIFAIRLRLWPLLTSYGPSSLLLPDIDFVRVIHFNLTEFIQANNGTAGNFQRNVEKFTDRCLLICSLHGPAPAPSWMTTKLKNATPAIHTIVGQKIRRQWNSFAIRFDFEPY